jgi:outer membrane protein OmpU
MNTLKKIGLTALAGSLVATSVFAGEMSVSGSAGLTFAGQDKTTAGNGFTMSDEITFSGGGEMDNGWTVAVSMQLDNNAVGGAGEYMDNRSIKIGMGDAGTISFVGHGGDSALGAVDDVMPHADGNETWDTIGDAAGGTASFNSISGVSTNNMFSYNNSSIVDGLSFTASLTPSNGGTNVESTMSYAVAYTGVDGLTVGYAMDENSEAGALQTDFTTMYAKYAYGPVTVGYQVSEEDSATAADNDEFTAYGISYAVSDALTISYNESSYDAATVATDQEITAIAVSYTMGSMAVSATSVSMDNAGGSTAALDDVQGYELNLSFAFSLI